MTSYELFGGPCHWDLQLHFQVAIDPTYLTDPHGAQITDGDGNYNKGQPQKYFDKVLSSLKKKFDESFNPGVIKAPDDFTLYTFGACPCSYHIDADFTMYAGTATTTGAALDGLPPNTGLIEIIPPLDWTGHAHAEIGGRLVVVGADFALNSPNDTLAHEIGHILGLPDDYTHDADKQSGAAAVTAHGDHHGHLMSGTGSRKLAPHEIEDIATHVGMTCNVAQCCPPQRQAHPVHGGHGATPGTSGTSEGGASTAPKDARTAIATPDDRFVARAPVLAALHARLDG